MGFLVFYVVGLIFVGWLSHHRGRSPITWVLISILISPLLGALLLVLMEPLRVHESKELRELRAIRREVERLKQGPPPPPKPKTYATDEERMLAEIQEEERRKAAEMRGR